MQIGVSPKKYRFHQEMERREGSQCKMRRGIA